MPEINIKQIDCCINIDVFCGTCGAGLCHVTDVNERRQSFTVSARPECMAEKDERIKELESIIEKLDAEEKGHDAMPKMQET